MAVQILFTRNYAFVDGAFAAGALARFYATGTLTPVTVYSDDARTVPHPVPLVADASGRFPAVWGENGVNLKAVITEADGSAIDTYDPVVLGDISAQSASGISFAPVADNAATNVQDAIANNTASFVGLLPVVDPSGSANKFLKLDASGTTAIFADPTDQATFNTGTGLVETTITPAKLQAKLADAVPGFLNATGDAPTYSVRLWANLNGADPVAINESGNVATFTRSAAGVYEITFTDDMPVADYAVSFAGSRPSPGTTGQADGNIYINTQTASALNFTCVDGGSGGAATDLATICITIVC